MLVGGKEKAMEYEMEPEKERARELEKEMVKAAKLAENWAHKKVKLWDYW